MAKRRTRKKRSGGLFSRLRGALTAPSWSTIRRTGVATTWLAAVVAAIVGWIYGVPQLESRVSAASINTANRIVDVEFIGAPSWAEGDLEAMLAHTARMHLSPDPLAHDELIDARDALIGTGCFEAVHQIRRVSGSLVEVHATFLSPYVVVRHANRDWIIDRAGRLLPPNYRASDRTHFLAIQGVRYDPPSEPAQRWDGTDITAALQLARVLDPQPWVGQIDAIDVTGYMHGQPIRLITDRSSVLIWHSPPGEETAGEVDTAEKIRRMTYMFERWGHVDAGYENEVDLADPQGVFAK